MALQPPTIPVDSLCAPLVASYFVSEREDTHNTQAAIGSEAGVDFGLGFSQRKAEEKRGFEGESVLESDARARRAQAILVAGEVLGDLERGRALIKSSIKKARSKSDAPPEPEPDWRVALKGNGNKTDVTVQSSSGGSDVGENGQRIAALLVSELK